MAEGTPPILIPQAFMKDPALRGYTQELHSFLYLMWVRTGGGTDDISGLTAAVEALDARADETDVEQGVQDADIDALELRADETDTEQGVQDGRLTQNESDLLERVTWLPVWVPGTYPKNTMTRDGSWAMVSNKETAERPSPQLVGTALQIYPDPPPTWTVTNYVGHVYSAIEIQVPNEEIYAISNLRAWVQGVTADDHYEVYLQNLTTGIVQPLRVFDGDVVGSPGWLTIGVSAALIPPGELGRVFLHQWNSVASNTQTAPYIRLPNTNDNGDPLDGNWSTRNNGANVRISYTDEQGADQTALVTDVGLVGTLITMTQQTDANKSMSFIINSGTTEAGFVLYNTTQGSSGAGGEPDVGAVCNIDFEIPIVLGTDYVSLAGHLAQFPDLQGYLAFDSAVGGIASNDGFGIDLTFDEYSVSEDWDILAVT